MKRAFGRFAQRQHRCRVDTKRSLNCTRAVHGHERLFGQSLAGIAPSIKGGDNLVRHVFLQCNEEVVGGSRSSIIAHPIGKSCNGRH
jgi:hypothetical protein